MNIVLLIGEVGMTSCFCIWQCRSCQGRKVGGLLTFPSYWPLAERIRFGDTRFPNQRGRLPWFAFSSAVSSDRFREEPDALKKNYDDSIIAQTRRIWSVSALLDSCNTQPPPGRAEQGNIRMRNACQMLICT